MTFPAKAVIFDLDGTLLDTLSDLADSANHVLGQLGLPVHERDSYRYMVGNGIEKLVERMLPADQRQRQEEVVATLRRHYSKHWADTTAPYPAIPDLLTALQERQLPLAVLSNKPEELTRATVAHYFAAWSFAEVAGARADFGLKPQPERAHAMARRLGIAPQEILMVGDSSIDMETAANSGMTGIGVLWGFRGAEELLDHGARALIKQPLELLDLIGEDS
ncbi:MAG: HAD family hydrolase [Thermodesulfobacteriota bacterium]